MKPLLAIVATNLLLTACAIPVTFESMTSEQLYAYNEDKPVLEQVYCTKEARTSSRIRKTYCDTVEGWVLHNQREASKLQVMSLGGGSVIRSRD